MAEINDWSTTAASNNSTPPDGWPENMVSSDVNDTAREGMAVLKRAWTDGVEGNVNSTGSAGAYIVAANRGITAYYDGMRIGFHANHANTGAATVDVDSVGAKSITKYHNIALAANDIETDQYVDLIYSASDDAFQLQTPVANEALTTSGDGSSLTGVDLIGLNTIWVPATAMTTRTTNGAAPGTVETTTNKVMLKTYDFDASTDEFVQFTVQMPKSWDAGTVTAQFVWSHPSTATNFGVRFFIQGVSFADDDALDTAFGTAVGHTADTGGTTDDVYISPTTAAVTIAGAGKSEFVTFQVYRDVSDAGDTLAVDARLHGVSIFYTTDAGNDA